MNELELDDLWMCQYIYITTFLEVILRESIQTWSTSVIYAAAPAIRMIEMQVYQRFQRLMLRLEPNFPFAEVDFTDSLNTLVQAVERHPLQIPSLMPELLSILPDMLAVRANFSLAEFADLYSFLVRACHNLPEKSHQVNEQMLAAAVLTLSNISLEVGEDWSQPAQSRVEDGLECCEAVEIRISKEIVDRVSEFANSIGYKWARVHFIPNFRKYFQFSTDWRQKYGALLVASQLMVESEELSEVKDFIEGALTELNSPHPKIKYAVLELLGQAGDHLRPGFQQAYFERVAPLLLRLLWDNPPRVSCHALACLSNFFLELRHSWQVETVLSDLLPPLLNFLRGPPFQQQCALDLVSSLGAIRNSLGTGVATLVQACGEILQQSLLLKSREMTEDVLDSLSVLLSSQEQQQVSVYIPHFVESLLANHQNISDDAFFQCWLKLCQTYKCFVALEPTNLVTLLVGKAGRMAQQGIEEAALLGLEGLGSTFTAFESALRPYTMQLYQFCKGILQDEENERSVRNKSIDLIVQLLLTTRPINQRDDSFLNEAMSLFQFLIQKGDENIQPEGDPHLLRGVLDGIISLIEPLRPRLAHNVVTTISDKLMSYKQHIEEMTAVAEVEQEEVQNEPTHTTSNDQDSSYQDTSDNDSDLSASELLDIAELIPQVYTKLLTLSEPSDRCMLVSVLVPQIPFAMGKGEDWKPFGIALALALTEGCEYQNLQAYWGDLTGLFVSFSTHPRVQLRNPSVYGAGLAFEKIPATLVSSENVGEWLQVLWSSLETPYEPGEEKSDIQHCQDNIMSALGKLLWNYGVHFPQILTREVYQKWLLALPLRHDEQERNRQHEILLEMLTSNPSLLLSDASGLKRILEIIADYLLLNSEDSSPPLAKTKECFGRMAQWDLFQRSSSFLWDSLSLGQKRVLAQLMSSS